MFNKIKPNQKQPKRKIDLEIIGDKVPQQKSYQEIMKLELAQQQYRGIRILEQNSQWVFDFPKKLQAKQNKIDNQIYFRKTRQFMTPDKIQKQSNQRMKKSQPLIKKINQPELIIQKLEKKFYEIQLDFKNNQIYSKSDSKPVLQEQQIIQDKQEFFDETPQKQNIEENKIELSIQKIESDLSEQIIQNINNNSEINITVRKSIDFEFPSNNLQNSNQNNCNDFDETIKISTEFQDLTLQRFIFQKIKIKYEDKIIEFNTINQCIKLKILEDNFSLSEDYCHGFKMVLKDKNNQTVNQKIDQNQDQIFYNLYQKEYVLHVYDYSQEVTEDEDFSYQEDIQYQTIKLDQIAQSLNQYKRDFDFNSPNFQTIKFD